MFRVFKSFCLLLLGWCTRSACRKPQRSVSTHTHTFEHRFPFFLRGVLRFRFLVSLGGQEEEPSQKRSRGRGLRGCAGNAVSVRKKRREEEPSIRASTFRSRREGAITNTPFSVAVNDQETRLPLGSLARSLPLLMI